MYRIKKDIRYQLVDGCPHDVFYISPIPIRPNGLFYEINRCGYTAHTQDGFYIERNENYRFNVIHCVLSGGGMVEFRGQKYPVSAGQLFVLPSNEGHCYFSNVQNNMSLLWVEFLGGDSDRLVKYIVDSVGPVFDAETFDAVVAICKQLVMGPSAGVTEDSQSLYSILTVICSQCMKAEAHQSPAIHLALRYIDAHLGEALTLTTVSDLLGYHPAYFSNLFSKSVGMSFRKYIMQRRINQACYFLMTTKWSVERISQELGYFDVSHFDQRFKSLEGVTPSQYRKESQGLGSMTASDRENGTIDRRAEGQ